MKLRTAVVVFVGVVAASYWTSHVVAQTAPGTEPAPVPRFEVASVKPNRAGGAGEAISHIGMRPDGSFTALNMQVSGLVRVAYEYPSERIIGLPPWTDEEGFDVIAKLPAAASPSDAIPRARIVAMLRSLLAERFKLMTHIDTRESAAYELRLARADGRLGPGLVRAEREDCAAMLAGRSAAAAAAIAGSHTECGFAMTFGSVSGGGIQIDQLAHGPLTQLVGRPVLDRTGLTGTFDLALTLPFGETPSVLPLVRPGEPVPVDPNRPTIFTAIQEQLGLKLESVRAPVDVLVIDHVERPDPD